MGFVDFVHLFFDVGVVAVALLRREGAVLRVQELCMGMLVLECSKEFIAEDFVAALSRWREGFQVVVVQGPGRGVIQDFPIRLVEDEIDGVGCRTVGQPLASEDHAVPGEASFEGALRAIGGGITELGQNGDKSILEQSLFDTRVPVPTYDHVKVPTNLGDASKTEHFGQGPTQGVDDLMNDNGIKFVCQLPWLAIRRVG
jgi:hypothetical protein